MPRVIILDTFPLSSTAKQQPLAGRSLSALDRCHHWIEECIRAGNQVVAPAISYYEVVRELERLGASAQISRLRTFCHTTPDRYLALTDYDLNLAAKLWAQSRNSGIPTAHPESLDGDVLLAAQALGLRIPVQDLVVATTNVAHLSRFVPAEIWTDIDP